MKITFKVHPLLYIMILITFLTGYFKDMVIFLSIIMIHEFGHILVGILLGFKVDKVIIFPFGGLTVFDEKINCPLNKELMVAMGGPLIQILFTFLLDILFNNQLFTGYSLIILTINLLPIYPLDGGKIINILLNKIASFKLAHKIIIYFSYLMIIVLFLFSLYKFNLIFVLFLILIMVKVYKEDLNHELIFEKFLYERYLYKLKFKKVKIVPKITKFKRDYYHYLKKDNQIIEEALILKKKFDFK